MAKVNLISGPQKTEGRMIVLRTFLLILAAMQLSGCWLSEGKLFEKDDLANVGLDGEFEITGGSFKLRGMESVSIKPNADGTYRVSPIVSDNWRDRFGLKKPIPPDSNIAFVQIPRSEPGTYIAFDVGADLKPKGGYFIASATGYAASFYLPNCEGTAKTQNLEIKRDSYDQFSLCNFKTKEALFDASTGVSRFLKTPQAIILNPAIRIRKIPDKNENFVPRPSPSLPRD